MRPQKQRFWFLSIALGLIVSCQSGAEHESLSTNTEQPSAIQVTRGEIFLARRGIDICAVRLLGDQTSEKVEYEAFHHTDDGAGFTSDNVTRTVGTVFENYKRERKGDVDELTELGGQQFIECGPFNIEWSAGNWIYTWGDFEIASTGHSTLLEIDVHDAALEWHDGGE